MKMGDVFEGALSPIPKTDKFIRFHGNYCGPGNRGGDPVDALDAACQKHDVGYHHTPDPKKRLKHDASFVKMLDAIAADKSHPTVIRTKAKVFKTYFVKKLSRETKNG